MFTAITRKPARSVSECELTYVEREPIDYRKALSQHDAYERVLKELGCRVISLPADEHFPDSVFVEDTAVILSEIAILMSPGAESRRGEVDSIETALSEYRDVLKIDPPAFIDGGDVLTAGKTIFVGQSTRSNGAGFVAFRELARRFGYQVRPVDIGGYLHLKTACTALDDETLLINTDWLDISDFKEFKLLETSEASAGNCLRIGDSIVMHTTYVETIDSIRDAGYDVETVDISEFGKMEAAVTCLSLIIGE